MIHVAYRLGGGDGFYAKMLGTSMLSMFENTKEKVTVHIMHNDSLTPDNRGKFYYIAGQYNQKIEFHHAEKIAAESLKRIEEVYPTDDRVKRYTLSIWYSFIIHEIFPNQDKIIFLGTDTIINLDISELWEYDLGEYGLGAVSEYLFKGNSSINPISKDGYVNHEDYFNADVLIINPKFFKENFERILECCKFIHDKNYPFVDQDTLNYFSSGNYLHLPKKFNAVMFVLYGKPEGIGKAIYHYAAHKPDLNADHIYNKLYLEYFLKTPWATADMFGNIDKFFRRQYDRLKGEFLRYTNLLYGRERLFLIDKSMTEKMRKIFAIRDDETIIDASDSVAMDKFFETLDELRDKKLIYLLSNNFNPVEDKLRKRDFLGGRDYVNAFIFLSEKDGGRWLVYDSRAVVREM